MRIIAIIIFSCFSILGCQDNASLNSKNNPVILDNLDSLKETETSISNKYISPAIENKILGDINFDDTQNIFTKKFSSFIKNSKQKDSKHLTNNPQIGNYIFSEFGAVDLYYQDKLYYLRLIGIPINLESYPVEVPEQVNYLSDVIIQQYGQPTVDFQIPDRLEIEKGYVYNVRSWKVGKKNIEIQIQERNYSYTIDLSIYNSVINDLVEKIDVEESLKLTKEAKNTI